MHFMCSYTSGYFPIYGDEYERVHYANDDGYASGTQGSANLRTSLWTTSSTTKSPGGCKASGDPSSHVWVVCREALHIQFCLDWRLLI